MTFRKWIAAAFASTITIALASIVVLLGALVPSQVVHASGGDCKWEGGSGAEGGHDYCFSEDCLGRGGLAYCTAGVGAAAGRPDSQVGPDKWTFSACDEAAAQMWRIAAWCTSAGGQ